MGYGEFLGGGSVDWSITHGKGKTGSGNDQGGKGHDDDPPKGGRFFVYIDGALVKPPSSKPDGKVLVAWGEGLDENTPFDQVKQRATSIPGSRP
jgi:hypothetical protein